MGLPKQQDFHGRLELAVRSILSPVEGGRSQNEDNFLIIDAQGYARFMSGQQDCYFQLDDWPPGHIRLAILDGMGGHSFGREAAERTVQGMLAIPAMTDAHALASALEKLHHRLHQEMHNGLAEPGCTLTTLELPPDGPALLFHVSDSRLYRVDADEAACLTVDHVPATKFALRGMIDEEEWNWQVHEQSGYQISQAFVLGNTLSDPTVYEHTLDADLFELHDGNLPAFLRGRGDRRCIELQSGPTYLLASDGLWNLSRPQAFIHRWSGILGRPDKPVKAMLDELMVELILAASQEKRPRGDNSTAIAFRVLS